MARLKVAGDHADDRQPAGAARRDPRRRDREGCAASWGPLTPQQEEALEALTRGIINKIAHGPISELRKHAGVPEGVHVVDAIRKVFHLKDKCWLSARAVHNWRCGRRIGYKAGWPRWARDPHRDHQDDGR